MDKNIGLSAIRSVLDSGRASQTYIAESLGISQSQVSRIAAGDFKRMSGRALEVCKFAFSLQITDQPNSKDSRLVSELKSKVAQLAKISPSAAEGLTSMLDALIEDLSSARSR